MECNAGEFALGVSGVGTEVQRAATCPKVRTWADQARINEQILGASGFKLRRTILQRLQQAFEADGIQHGSDGIQDAARSNGA